MLGKIDPGKFIIVGGPTRQRARNIMLDLMARASCVDVTDHNDINIVKDYGAVINKVQFYHVDLISEKAFTSLEEGALVYSNGVAHLVGLIREDFPLHDVNAFSIYLAHEDKAVVVEYHWDTGAVLFYKGNLGILISLLPWAHKVYKGSDLV